ncbi:MAG: hypothetical protein R3F18_02145 [Lysobacterales bacterium]
MTTPDRIATLPARLRAALRIWLGMALLSLLTPAAIVADVGWLAQPWFWAGLLPLLALLPYRRQLLQKQPTGCARRVGAFEAFMRQTRVPLADQARF